jgi:Ran GTPase-activating protein (RanGAP) involved in mRNA processing and transport
LSQRGLRSSDAKLVKLALLQNAKLSSLKLGYNQLGDEGVSILSNGVCVHQVLTSLDLGFNQIGDVGCAALADAIIRQSKNSRSNSSSLETLYLAGNLITHQGAVSLADAIRYSNLRKLHLTGNSLGVEGISAIVSSIIDHDGISELFLGGTFRGSIGCHSVARLFRHSSCLKVISLANCNVNDDDIAVLAENIKENRHRLPLEALQLSFNSITCQGLDQLINALWGSRTLRELQLDNNHIGERGGHQLANILPHIKTLQVLDIGFNSIPSSGMRTLMKVVAEAQHLLSLSISGNSIDISAAKAVAYALAYNRSLTSVFLDHCMIERDGQRHIIAGVVSNSGIRLRKLTGFQIGRKWNRI